MENVPLEIRRESISALQSAIHKLEEAFSGMTEKGSNTTLVRKRLRAFIIGLTALERAWNVNPRSAYQNRPFTWTEVSEAHEVLLDLLPQLKSAHNRQLAGSPQRTLLKRRIKAVELAVCALGQIQRD